MPDLKDKHSGSRLNPSERDFDDIVNQPDMQALDDRGDAIARDDEASKLRDAENGAASDSDGVGDAEQKKQKPDNKFGYQPNNKQKSDSTRPSNRKKLAGLGIGGGVLGGILISIFMLLPLKIPGIMQMISDEAGQRVEQVTERRAKIIIARAIFQKFATSGNGIVITGNGPFSTLVASMRTNNFEKKLADKGLKIERTNDGVKLSVNNDKLENGKVLKTELDVYRALDGHPVTNKMVKNMVKEEIPSWRWMKKAKFAKWLRIKYGIPRYGIKNSTEADEKARIKEMNESRLGPEYEALANDMGEAAECAVNTECDFDQEEGKVTEDAKSGDLEAVEDTTAETGKELASSNDPTKTLITQVVDKLGSKAIPIIGWIDLVATIDHIAWEASENQYFGKLAAHYRAKAYARHFGNWSGYGSQIQLGALDPAFIGTLATQTEGIEESQAFNLIEGDASKGVKPEKINDNNPGGITKDLQQFTDLIGGSGGVSREAAHQALNLYYESLGGGGLLGWASDKIGGFLSSVIKFIPGNFEEWFGKMIEKAMVKVFAILGLDFDPKVKGAQWFNAAHGGATWTYNDFCDTEMGCRKLTPQQASIENSVIASERAEYKQQKGLAYALLSTESSSSLVSQMAIDAPTSIASAATKFGRIITSTPATLLGAITGKTSAAGYTDIHGVDPFGATEEDLNQPLAPQAITGEECPEVSEGEYNNCKIDTLVAEAMICEFEQDSEDCGEDTASLTTGEGFSFTIGSYNILHSEHHTPESMTVGGCAADPVAGDPRCARTRTERQVQIITGQVNGIPAFDVFGTQENSPEQYNLLKEMLPDYDAFPENADRMSNQQDGAVGLYWNKTKFTKFASGKYEGLSNVLNVPTGGNVTTPWVGLETAGGHKIYVTSIHFANDGYGGTNEKIIESAEKTVAWAKTVVAEDATIFVVGDFNDQLQQKLSYCAMTREGFMSHARDMAKGVGAGQECPQPNNIDASIDHIYLTPTQSATVSKWRDVPMSLDPIISKASDHTPVYATVEFPGEETAGGGTEPIPYKNPVAVRNIPDPSVIRAEDGTYHVYGTGGSGANPFVHLTSTDLVNWKQGGPVLQGHPSGILTNLSWAPDVAKVGNNYILTFTGGSDANRIIGYGTSSSAGGPFKYKGILVKSGEYGQPDGRGTIDSHIFVDGDTPYLFFGGGIISVVPLSVSADGTITKKDGRKILISRNSTATVEGSWVQKQGSWYYLYYSFGKWENKSGPAEYSTRVARSKSVMGPYEPTSPYRELLTGADPFRGPGHNSVTRDNAGNEWIVYHAWSGGNRVLMIDPITYVDDWPVVRSGHPSSGTQNDGPANGGGDGSSAVGSMVWPIRKTDWPTGSMPIAECGLLYSDGTVHTGIDISVGTGTGVYAAASGRIVSTGGSYGMITIETSIMKDGSPVFVNYQHMSKISVQNGQTVTKGDKIGNSGSTGTSSPHLHFSTWKVAGPLSGHQVPSQSSALSNIYHPMQFLPKDGRNVNECIEPYVIPS